MEPHKENGSGRGVLFIRGGVVGGKIVADISIGYSSGTAGILSAYRIVHSAPDQPMKCFHEAIEA